MAGDGFFSLLSGQSQTIVTVGLAVAGWALWQAFQFGPVPALLGALDESAFLALHLRRTSPAISSQDTETEACWAHASLADLPR